MVGALEDALLRTDFVFRFSCHSHSDITGPPRLLRPPRPGPCLNFGFQYALIRNNWSKKFGVEYWALHGSNSLWRPCQQCLLSSFVKNYRIHIVESAMNMTGKIYNAPPDGGFTIPRIGTLLFLAVLLTAEQYFVLTRNLLNLLGN